MTVQLILAPYFFHESRKSEVLQYLNKIPAPYDRKRDVLIEWAKAVDVLLTKEDFDAIGATHAAIQS